MTPDGPVLVDQIKWVIIEPPVVNRLYLEPNYAMGSLYDQIKFSDQLKDYRATFCTGAPAPLSGSTKGITNWLETPAITVIAVSTGFMAVGSEENFLEHDLPILMGMSTEDIIYFKMSESALVARVIS
jgi:hypothetical protein